MKSNSEIGLSVEEVAGELAMRFPRFVPLAELVSHCVGSYPDALSGRIPAVTVLYPDGTSDWLDAVMDRLPQLFLRCDLASRRGGSHYAHGRQLAIRCASLKSAAAPAGSLPALRN